MRTPPLAVTALPFAHAMPACFASPGGAADAPATSNRARIVAAGGGVRYDERFCLP